MRRDLVTRAGSALVVQAGTATSTRLRDEEQSFNLIEVARRRRDGDGAGWDGSGFASRDAQRYRRDGEQWRLRAGRDRRRGRRKRGGGLKRLRRPPPA